MDTGTVSSLGLLQIMLYQHSQCLSYACTCWICIKQSTNTAKQFFKMVLLVQTTYESSCCFISCPTLVLSVYSCYLPIFKMGSFLLLYKNSLYTLDINALLAACTADTFIHRLTFNFLN